MLNISYKHSSGRHHDSEIRSYAPLILLPLLLGSILLGCVSIVTNRQINNNGDSTVDNFQSKVSGILREIQLVSDILVSNEQFQFDMNTEPYQDFMPADLCSMISSCTSQSDHISQVYVINSRQEQIYSDRAIYSYDSLTAILRYLTVSPTEYIEDFLDESIDISDGWHVLNERYTPPYYVTTLADGTGQGKDTTVIFTINMRGFLEAFMETDSAVCSIFNDSISISSLLVSYPSIDWADAGSVGQAIGKSVKCFYSEQEDFTYMVAIETGQFYASLYVIVSVFLMYFVVVSVVSLIQIRHVNKRRNETLSEMIDQIPSEDGRNPKYSELLSVLRETLEEYKKQKQDLMRIRNEEMRQQLLSGAYSTFGDAELLRAGIAPSSYGYCVALIHMWDSHGILSGAANESPDAEYSLTGFTCESAISKLSSGRLSASVTYYNHDYCAVISVLDAEVDYSYLSELLEQVAIFFNDEYGQQITIALSRRISEIADLPNAYDEAMQLYNFVRTVDSSSTVVLQSDLEADPGTLLKGDFANQLQVLSGTCMLGKYSMIPQLTQSILQDHVTDLKHYYNIADYRLKAVTDVLIETLIDLDIDEKYKSVCIEKLCSSNSVSRLQAAVDEIFRDLDSQLPVSGSRDIVGESCRYISEHLSDFNLGVPSISEAVGVTAQYLSRIFKKKMGMALVEYINRCRLEAAKKLLLESNDTIISISEKVGYNNKVTLTRNFKRYIGMTPSEYRSLNSH